MSFVHLHCHSPFSFLDGASPIPALVEAAAALGMPALALTDHDNVCGAVALHKACARAGIKPIQGAEVTLPGGRHLTLLATGPAGYRNLCRLLTRAHLESERLHPTLVTDHLNGKTDGLIALSGCRRGEIPALLLRRRHAEARAAARRYKAAFGDGFYLELQAGRLPGEANLHRALAELGEAEGIPLVATADVHYRCKDDFFIHDLLTCVRTLTRLDETHPERRLNAENYLKSPAEMAAALARYPAAVQNTLAIAERCEPALALGVSLFPGFDLPPGETAEGLLRRLTFAGAERRYGRVTAAIAERLEHELGIICQLGFPEYFLLVWDVCRFAREKGARFAGRGSAADSAVAYCLGITDVDSFARGLLFERFMSLERAEKPDIDVDFDYRYRDRVAEYVYAKYGRDKVASVCTYNTFAARSAVRDLGKAMGFPPEEIDRIAKRLPYFGDAREIGQMFARLPELRASGIPVARYEQLFAACAAVDRFPRFIGTHLGGLVISREPLECVTPLQMAAKGHVICQFDRNYVEDLGLVKLDLLSLRTLGAVGDTVKAVNREGITLDYDALQPTDPEVYKLLNSGETVGIFQLESPAQRALQARLGADRFEDIVASVALIRPGPIQGNMVEPFVARRQGLAPIAYLHPKLEPILAKTYGVVLFQEQVIQIATAIAGFTPGEADKLRRVMTHARRVSDMQAIGETFIQKAIDQGVERGVAETIFSYIVGYAGYGFCEAHAAAFAGTAYKTAHLLRYHPAEFFAAILSHQPMGYYSANTIIGEARRRAAAVLPLDINASGADFSVESLPEGRQGIRLSLRRVKGMSESALQAILAARGETPFAGLPDLLARTGGAIARSVAEALILAGAFDSLHPHRRHLLWQLPALLAAAREQPAAGRLALPAALTGAAPDLPDFSLEEKYLKEYELLGIMVRGHYMGMVRPRLDALGFLSSAAVKQVETGAVVKAAGVVITPHRPPTRSGRTVVFFSLEDECGLLDVTCFEDVYQRYGHHIFTDPRPPLAVLGRIERRGNGVSLTAQRLRPLWD